MAAPKLDNNTVYLVDGSGYIFRAYFAVRSLSSKKGVPTNAVYGFTTMLLKLIREHKPRYLAIAFDLKEPTFRHKIYEGYKANRPAPPADLVPQFALIHQIVEAFNIKILSKPGYEADDLIGTLAERAKKAHYEVVVVTGDKDLMQLVDDQVFLLDELRAAKIGSEKFIDAHEVKKEMGVWPNQVVDLLALAGDSSDNIPGVSGIGVKTAAELIEEFGALERILEMTPLIKQKSRREKLIDGNHLARLSKQLVTIDRNVDFDCTISDLKYQNIDQEKTRALFSELDFNRLLQDPVLFSGPKPATSVESPSVDRAKYLTINDDKNLQALVSALAGAQKIAIDIQSDNPDPIRGNLVGIALAWGDNQAAYIPLKHDTLLAPQQLQQEYVLAQLKPILQDMHKIIIAHDAKHEFKILQRLGINIHIGGDPMLANYLLHQDQERHNLLDLSLKYLGFKPLSLDAGEKKDKKSLWHLPLPQVSEYAACQADVALRLEKMLVPKLAQQNLSKLYDTLELPLEEVLSRMELAGVAIDTHKLKELHDDLNERLLKLEKQAHELAMMEFNLGSPKQVAHVLFEKLSLGAAKKTKTGFSTDSSVLEKLVSKHPLAQVLLEHRLCAKLINTYVDSLPALINPITARLHTSYNQFVTATGRLSSSDPNLQNIPIRTSEGRRVRQAFVAKPGYVLISLDYSQVELRILAYISGDEVMLDAFAKDQDVHKRTASEIFEVDLDHVSKEQRNTAKTINFGLLYGMGSQRLAETLNISRSTAQAYLAKYFAKYSKILLWKNQALEQAKKNNEVRTLFGRKRDVKELSSANAMLRARAERLAINTPIQGTNADIIKKAMIDTDEFLRVNYPDSHLLMQVHDELVIEAKKEHAPQIAQAVSKIMSHGHGLELDLKVEYGIASNWDDAH